jgi:uncharacterized protein
MDVVLQHRLGKAIWREDIREVIALLDSGADLEEQGENGFTPLMQAAEMENLAIAQLLLDRGARINGSGYRAQTALHIAVDISIDATVQRNGKQGEEPTAMIEFLLARGASPFARDEENKTPRDWAKDFGSQKVSELLKSWEEKNAR